jgi:hypothetical protein
MTERGTPVVILFIITICVMLYNYIGQFAEVNRNLHEEIYSRDLIIKEKTEENDAMVALIGHLWYRQTGEILDDTWTEIPNNSKNNPVH